MITIILVIYLYCKHKHIRTIIASLILHKVKEVEANILTKSDNTKCQTLTYIGIALTLLSISETATLKNSSNIEMIPCHYCNQQECQDVISIKQIFHCDLKHKHDQCEYDSIA